MGEPPKSLAGAAIRQARAARSESRLERGLRGGGGEVVGSCAAAVAAGGAAEVERRRWMDSAGVLACLLGLNVDGALCWDWQRRFGLRDRGN